MFTLEDFEVGRRGFGFCSNFQYSIVTSRCVCDRVHFYTGIIPLLSNIQLFSKSAPIMELNSSFRAPLFGKWVYCIEWLRRAIV